MSSLTSTTPSACTSPSDPAASRRSPSLTAVRRASTDSVWRDADFLRFWTGHSVSQLGTAMTQVALPLVALLTLGATAAEVGLLRTAEFLPYLLLTLPAGALVDRVRRRPLMVGCDLWRAAFLVLVPV